MRPMIDVDAIARASVLVVGDVILDEYVWGRVDRISPEAPVHVVDVRDRTCVPGGAANVAAGVASLGARAVLVGVVGDDEEASDLRRTLVDLDGDRAGLVVDPQRRTTAKTRVIANAQQVVRTDRESREDLTPEIEDGVRAAISELLESADVVVLSDYRKGVVTAAVAAATIERARDLGKPVVVDSKGTDFAKYEGATVITPNAGDAGRAANVRIETDADLELAASRIAELCGSAALLITRGAAGMSLFHAGGRFDVRAEAHEVFDVTGAGDTVVAVLAAALGSGFELVDAVRLANAAAGIVVGKVGTATVSLDELRAGER